MSISGAFQYELSRNSTALADVNAIDDSDYSLLKTLDDVIDSSMLKVRQLQASAASRNELRRILVLDTLHHALLQKLQILHKAGRITRLDSVAFAMALNESVKRLGIGRFVRLIVEPAKELDGLPKIRWPTGKKYREEQAMEPEAINEPLSEVVNLSSPTPILPTNRTQFIEMLPRETRHSNHDNDPDNDDAMAS